MLIDKVNGWLIVPSIFFYCKQKISSISITWHISLVYVTFCILRYIQQLNQFEHLEENVIDDKYDNIMSKKYEYWHTEFCTVFSKNNKTYLPFNRLVYHTIYLTCLMVDCHHTLMSRNYFCSSLVSMGLCYRPSIFKRKNSGQNDIHTHTL